LPNGLNLARINAFGKSIMRILILSQYYPPETGAPQNRLSDLARRLARSGHDLTVLTAMPNYPRGEVFEEYRNRFLVTENHADIKVIRTWIYATKKKTFIRRLLNYFSFVVSSVVLGIWKIGSPDVVIVESPPLFLGISGLLLSASKNAKLVLNVSDLWPDSAVAMGILSNCALIRASRWLEQFLYRRSALITGQTRGIVDNIQSRFRTKNVALITNGVDVAAFLESSNAARRTETRREFAMDGKFVIGYAGLHGLAQGLSTVIHAAGLLGDQQDVLFAFFGDGPEKEKLIEDVGQMGLKNVRFYSSQPSTRMPAVIGSFDVAVIPLKRLDLFKGALPSKMFEALAAGVPLLASIEGEARELVEKAQAGLCIEPENPRAMADAILKFYKDPVLRQSLGRNGQRYVVEHFDRQKIADQFERLLTNGYRAETVSA
jgi:glycosyltransferase involved in cell wall biosynthesis